MIRNQLGKHNRSQMFVVQGSSCVLPHKDKDKDKWSCFTTSQYYGIY
jgi:hypothetical protein